VTAGDTKITSIKKMTSIKKRVLLIGVATCVTMAGASRAFSQEPTPAPQADGKQSDIAGVYSSHSAAANDAHVGDIVVTAQKRSQNLRDVPSSITALSGKDLADQHIVTADDLARAVPGLSFSPNSGGSVGVGVGSGSLTIRGVGSSVGASTVGLYVDDVPITQMTQAGLFSPTIFDLNRVEVLRGPQGTLYGASSEGGTVRYITNQPDLNAFGGYVSANISDTKHGSLNTTDDAVVNIPLIPGVLALRAGGEFTHNSGWIDRYDNEPGQILTPSNVLAKRDVNSEQDYALRFSLKWQPDSSLTITPTLFVQRDHQNDSPAFFVQDGLGLYKQSKLIAESATDPGVIGSLTIDKRMSFANLTSVSSYFSRRFRRNGDGTYYDPYFVVNYILDYDPRTAGQSAVANNSLALLPTTTINKDYSKTFNQEIRLSSPNAAGPGHRLGWVFGAYFNHATDRSVDDERAPGWNDLFQSIYGFDVNDAVQSPLANPDDPTTWQNNFAYLSERYTTTQVAAFGQVDYEILPKLTATAGLRYQYSRLSVSTRGSGYYLIGVPDVKAHTHDSAVTPKFSLTYAAGQKSNLYATAAKGYRDGGFNGATATTICAAGEAEIGLNGAPPIDFKPDHLWSYEAGYKGLLADGNLSIAIDGYDIEWSKVQQQIVIPGCGFRYTSNVGSARAYGGEGEIRYRVSFIPGLTINANGSVEHATLTSVKAGSIATVGEHLLNTPKYTATLAAEYRRPISERLSFVIRANNFWQGKSNGDFRETRSDYVNHSYSILNAGFGIEGKGYEIEIFAKNLLNDQTLIREPTVASVIEGYTVPPMTFGIQARKSF
jgi:iron complex outermembrane receptor protein